MINRQLFFAPHPALAAVVNNIMIGEVQTGLHDKPISFSFPPLPEHSIIFFPHDQPDVVDVKSGYAYTLFPCTVTGQLTERTVLTLGKRNLMIKIGFQPGALHRLLKEPMWRMLPFKNYDGVAVFGSAIKETIDALANAGTFETMKHIADAFMLRQLPAFKKPVLIDTVIPEIIRYGGMIKIDDLVKKACLSNRQFERVFKERMGVSPKFYSRLVRFGKAWLMKETHPSLTWTEVAHSCNYFDQMHMIRDFNEFPNARPTEISAAFERETFRAVKGIFH
jgi:AraC-like DNA-binding protein